MSPAGASGIKPGKWEFTTSMQNMAMPKLPPGVKLPPNVHLGPQGSSYTTCITSTHPVPHQQGHTCTINRMTRSGDTVTWAATCATPEGPMHASGQAIYSGETMHSTTTIDGAPGSAMPLHMTQSTTGHYMGPCAE